MSLIRCVDCGEVYESDFYEGRCPHRMRLGRSVPTPPAPAMPEGARPVRREVLAGEAAELLMLRIRDAEQSAELATLRQRLAEAENVRLDLKRWSARLQGKDVSEIRDTHGLDYLTVISHLIDRKLATAQADAARWEGAARVMAEAYVACCNTKDKKHTPNMIARYAKAVYNVNANPTASALVREGGGGA